MGYLDQPYLGLHNEPYPELHPAPNRGWVKGLLDSVTPDVNTWRGIVGLLSNQSLRQRPPDISTGEALKTVADATPIGPLIDAATQADELRRAREGGDSYGTGKSIGDLAKTVAMAFVPGSKGVKAKGVAPKVDVKPTSLLAPSVPREPGDPRISTRNPTAVKATEDPLREHLNIGMPEIVAAPNAADITGLSRRYPGYKTEGRMTTAERAEDYVKKSTENLRFIYENVPESIRTRAPGWYPGAHDFNVALANRYGLPPASVHGATSALSPQKDWFQNASLSERVADIVHEKDRLPMSSDMRALSERLGAYNSPRIAPELEKIMGARFSDLKDPLHQAMWLRLYDEAHNPSSYRVMSPEGLLGPVVLNADGTPAKRAWGSFAEIGKAIQAIQSGGDTDVISRLMGDRHKVRNFYNNQAVPYETRFGDVTADTHAVAANQLRPLSGNTEAVSHNFGNSLAVDLQPKGYVGAPGSSLTGIQGNYGLNVEPYRRVGAEYGVLPRGVQSVTWEGVRGLFPDTFKTAENMQKVDQIWRAADRGTITRDEARRRIVELAGGFKEPDWARPGGLLSGEKPTSTYR